MPPRCRRRLSRAVPTAPPPVPEADHITIRTPCPCRSASPPLSGRLRRRVTLHDERSPSTPLPLFLRGLLSRASSPPPPRRRTAASRRSPHLVGECCHRSGFPPSRRQEAPVSYHLYPHARRVASPSWVLERFPLLHLRHGSSAAGHAAMRARRAVTAPVCAHAQCHAVAGHVHYAHGPSRRCGRGPRATVQLGRAWIRRSGSQISFLFSEYI
jgi:hypothetical protein